MMRLPDNRLEELRRVVNIEMTRRDGSPRLGSPEYVFCCTIVLPSFFSCL
jgi:hypothetical protein